MVTCNLPPFARIGSKIDVTVSSIGDARALKAAFW
jgi:flagellar basal body P-ring protein FlgI